MTAPGSSCSSRKRRRDGAGGRQPRLLVLAAHEPLVRPGRVEHLVELRLGHHVPAGVPVVEELDDLVHGRAVHERVVRGGRDPQHVGVLVLERAGQVGVDLAEAEAERLVDRATLGLDRRVDRRERREPLLGRRRDDAGTGSRRPPAGRAPPARTATPCAPGRRRSPRRGTGSARRGPGSSPRSTGAAPRRAILPRSASAPRPRPAGSASASPRPLPGKRPATIPGR